MQKKIRRGTILFFTEFPVSKKFKEKRGGHQDFLSKSFCVTVPEKFVGEPISVSLFLGNDKFYASEGYVTVFCRKYFATQCGKTW